MNTSISYQISNGDIIILIISSIVSIIVSFIISTIASERTFQQKIKGSTRVDWIEAIRKEIGDFYEHIYLIFYDENVNIKTLAKLRKIAEIIYLYCPIDKENIQKDDSNDLINEKTKRIFDKVEQFYFDYKFNKINSNVNCEKCKRIDDIKKDLDEFTDFIRKRFKLEWEKSKKAK